MRKAKLIEFPQHGDEKGYLVVIEEKLDVPFEINEYFIFTEVSAMR